MRIFKGVFFMSLCLLFGVCQNSDSIHIDIDDFENQRNAWDMQSLSDYMLTLSFWYESDNVTIIVRDGVPEISTPSSWLTQIMFSTVPELYSYIEHLVENMKNEHKKGRYSSQSIRVRYNTEYHYPSELNWSRCIRSSTRAIDGDCAESEWHIVVTPLNH